MRAFVPFDDDWTALARKPHCGLIPYQAGMPITPGAQPHTSIPRQALARQPTWGGTGASKSDAPTSER